MIYSSLTKKAMNIMYEAHKDQFDKAGVPYVFHSIHLAEQMYDEKSVIVALLHDVVEDTNIKLEELSCFGLDVVEALSLLTHSDDVDYFDYIEGLSNNSIARRVKIADLKHNADLSRLDFINEKDLKRRKKYMKSLEYLESIEKKFISSKKLIRENKIS